jgi:M6 family metalloprotease-like protein
MQRKSRLALAIVVLLSLSSPVYAAAPKAGSKCTKAGQTSTSAGIKYTCVKSGKKLVWNKGVVVKAPIKPEESPAPTVEVKDLLPVDSRIMPASELTSIDVCKTEDKSPDYQLLGKVLHKNGFPRPANSLSGKKSAKVLVIPLVFNNLPFKSVKTQTGQLFTSDLDMLNDVIPRVKDDFKRLSAGRFEVTIDVLPQSQWWVINSDNPFKYGAQVSNLPEIVKIIEKNKSDFKFDVYDTYIFLTGNGEPGQAGLGSGEAAFGDEIRNTTGNFNAVLMAGGYNGTSIWIHELGHSLYAFEDLYLFKPSASTNKNSDLDVPARWDLMAGSSIALLQWNKYLMGWIYDSEVRCLSDQKSSIHYLSASETSVDPKLLAINLTEGVTLAAEARTGTSDGAGLLLYTINTYIGHGNGPILAQKSLVAKGQTRAMLGWEFKALETNTKGILFSATKTDIDKFVPPAPTPKPNQNNPDPQKSVINVTRGDILPTGSLKGRATWTVTGHESYRLYVTDVVDFQKVYFETGFVNDSRNPLVIEISGLVCNKELRTMTEFFSKKNGEGERKVMESRQLSYLPCP